MDIDLSLQLTIDNGAGESARHVVPSLLISLMTQVDSQGNLSAAAKSCGISYRTGWNLVNQWSEILGSPLLEKTPGRGALLTRLGAELLRADRNLQESGKRAMADVLADISIRLKPLIDQHSNQNLAIAASHCVSHEVLENLISGNGDFSLSVKWQGSAESLELLSQRQFQAAGYHLPSGSMRREFVSIYSGYIESDKISSVYSHSRVQGFIVAPGNPKNLKGMDDLVGEDIRLINRQSGSGTRILLDQIMKEQKIAASKITGYEDEAHTHSAVCARIANRQADIGIGTEASATRYGLGFVPILHEDYYYAFYKADEIHHKISALKELLGSHAWRQAINGIAGYDASKSGSVFNGLGAETIKESKKVR